jgi:hypothetical protein
VTDFIGGPAAGKTLLLHRQPIYLRVVVNSAGEVDALDQLDDSPSADESLYAYRLKERRGSVHINRGRKGGGWFEVATYELIEAQPTDQVMRSSERWAEWTEGEYAKSQGHS